MLFADYLPAELHTCKSRWFVAYYVKNPKTGKLHRKTIKINRIKSATERKKFGRKLVLEINKKLETGWNPFFEQEAPKSYTKLTDALEAYKNMKHRELTSKDSLRTYDSQISILKFFLTDIEKTPDLPIISFDAHSARRYMDYLYNVRKLSGRTFNNYKAFTVTLWNWFIENLYVKTNPFEAVKKKVEKLKTRQIIDADTRQRIKNHLSDTNEHEYLAMIMLCFYGLIRPKEICLLRPEYFDFNRRIIVLPAEITKDKETRIVTISDDLLPFLDTIHVRTMPRGAYVFSDNFKPGTTAKDSRIVGKRWSKLRDELGMPAEYQFYSLKDSGIVQMLQNGVNPLDVRNQAGHASLDQTNEYAKYANPEGSDQIRKKSGKF